MRIRLLIVAFLVGPSAAPALAQSPILSVGDSVSRPVPIIKVEPAYPVALQEQKVQGSVRVTCVIETDGAVSDVTVARSLHPALDTEAVAALKQWRFRPARQYGEPVRVRVDVEVGFAMRGPVYESSDGVQLPVPITRVHPAHHEDARGVEGVVRLQAVVLPDGTVGGTRVLASLDPALDEEAMRAMKQWRFKPGTKDGAPVAVRITLEIKFARR